MNKLKTLWDWTYGKWSKLNTHAQWFIFIVVALLSYHWLVK